MTEFPFIHVSFAAADEATRLGWDGFVRDVFAPITMYEVLTTPTSDISEPDR